MQFTVPDYYKQFTCTAGQCPATCCAGWQIQIDPASLMKYRKARGPLKNRLRNEIDWDEKCFRRYGGRCAFLNDDNLCDLYLEGGGAKAFCRTCRTYPRHIKEFEGLREISLSLSCPAAAEIILGRPEPVRFLHAEDPDKGEPQPDAYDDFDYFLFTKLEDAREVLFQILQDRAHPVNIRAAAALAFAHDLQERIDHGALYDADRLLERYKGENVWNWFENRLELLTSAEDHAQRRRETLRKLFEILDRLEILQDDWKTQVHKAGQILTECSSRTDHTETGPDFSALFSDETAEQILVYFVFTYFCGAVYNYNAYGKMKFALAGMILIRELLRAQWISDPEGTGRTELIRTAYRYSREIEHSDFNKVRMEDLLSDEIEFPLEDLLRLL